MIQEQMIQQIAARKVQAMEREIREKAIHVALNLGSGNLDQRGSGAASCDRVMTDMVYKGLMPCTTTGELRIQLHSSVGGNSGGKYSTVEVSMDGSTVFLQRGLSIESYVPGVWEDELDRLQPVAETAKTRRNDKAKEKQKVKEKEETADLRRAWGL